jgi:NAD(P)-dependent dehydrogenase (short-subunit alcohol dehydrogenase family)
MEIANLGRKWALVTGSGSGIGRETALALARRGADLVICDVNEAGLEETRRDIEALGRKTISRPVDVAERDEMRAFAEAVHTEIPAVDILVNNAGVAVGGAFVDTPLDDWNWIVGINLMGVVHGCHFFVPRMIERGAGGHVVNIASMASYVAAGGMSAYNTTKFGVRGFSEALRVELAMHGIGVTVVCPGVINTPIVERMRLRGPGDTEENRQRGIDFFERRNYPPSRVAAGILDAIRKNKAVAPIAPEARLFWYLVRFFPGLVRRISRKIFEREAARG